MNRWTRREVLGTLGRLPILAGLAAVASACGGGGGMGYGSSGGGGGGMSTQTCTSLSPMVDYTISGNHGHTACMSLAQLKGTDGISPNNTVTLSNVGHTHTITISDTDMAAINAGTPGSYNFTSTTNSGHHHDVTYIV